MKVPKHVVDATASRTWRTDAVVRKPRPLPAADDLDAEEPPAPRLDAQQSVQVPTLRPALPGDLLLAALDAAGDDAQRALLLATSTVEAREQMSATLAYREFSTLAGRNPPLGALVAALDACGDEAARATLLAATSPALLVELAEHLRPPPRDIADAYMLMVQ
ncbi:MAG TPA: hypothetical protein VGH84_08675 [Steroidobacteraceae bacterium]